MLAASLLLLLAASYTVHAQDALPGMLMTCATENEFALTFDDGPSEFTAELLETLDAENVPATFFVLGQQVDNPQLQPVFKSIFAKGHQIAVHTYDHPHLNTLSADQVRDQLKRTDQAIRNVIGVSPQYMRPPYGECSAATQAVIQELGYLIVQWNLDSNDWQYADQGERAQAMVTTNFIKELAKTPSPKSASFNRNAIRSMAVTANSNPEDPTQLNAVPQSDTFNVPHLPSYISLQHDIQNFSVRQTRRIIQEIKKKGYRFVSVAECAGGMRKPMYSNGPDSVFKNTPTVVIPPAVPKNVQGATSGSPSPPPKSSSASSTQPMALSVWLAGFVLLVSALTWI